ncbi:MAG: RNA-binding domain-containing protein [Pontiella sp.]
MMTRKKWNPLRVIRTALVLTVLAAFVGAVVAVFIEREWRNISEQYIQDATQRAATQFQRMASEVDASLGMVCEWGRSGLLDPSQSEKAKKLLFPFFGKNLMLSGISIADTDGKNFFLQPDGSIRFPSTEKEYNLEERPWFTPALENEGTQWTDIYSFYTLEKLGITASAAWTEKGGTRAVVAFDILLDDFFNGVRQMAPTPASHAFIFLPDGQLYVPGTESAKSEFRSTELIKDKLAMQGLSLWDVDRVREEGELKVVQMRFEGEAWWCGFVPLEKSRKQVWMGVIVPEADIVGDIVTRRQELFGIGFVVFIGFSALYIFLTRRYGRSLPVEADITEGEVREFIRKGENRSVEFKSTMRMNLHTKKPGKEIELAWTKGVAGFLNTDGGTLLLGVTDDGVITGLEQDVFENEDKCRLHFKNLIAKHIGAEFSKYIRFILLKMDGKTVGVVRCARASEPVFLKDVNKEHFYIRNGPSSDELPVSKALEYIKHRKR